MVSQALPEKGAVLRSAQNPTQTRILQGGPLQRFGWRFFLARIEGLGVLNSC